VTLPWQRLSDRQRGVMPAMVLHEGVPDHLEPHIRVWIYNALQGGGSEIVALRLEIRIDYEAARGDAALFVARATQQYELLDVVDAILGCGGPWPRRTAEDRQRGTNSNFEGLAQLQRSRQQSGPQQSSDSRPGSYAPPCPCCQHRAGSSGLK
jgi:hypothetical protein